MGRHRATDQELLFTAAMRVLLVLDRDPQAVFTQIAARAGIHDRTVARVLHRLERAGNIQRERRGISNSYRINRDAPIAERPASGSLGELLETLRHDTG